MHLWLLVHGDVPRYRQRLVKVKETNFISQLGGDMCRGFATADFMQHTTAAIVYGQRSRTGLDPGLTKRTSAGT